MRPPEPRARFLPRRQVGPGRQINQNVATRLDSSGTVAPFGRLPAVAAAGVVGFGALVLGGWAFGAQALSRVFPAGIPTLPSTATGLVLAGTALGLLHPAAERRARTAGVALAAAAALLGLFSLCTHLPGVPFDADTLFFSHEARARYTGGRRMGINTATAFVLAGIALPLAARETRRGWRASQILGAAGFLVAFLALLGHLYGIPSLYTAGPFTGGMALPTSAGFLLLNLGVFFARPAHGYAALVTGDDASGVLARQLLPAAVLIPVGLGFFWFLATAQGWIAVHGAVSVFVILVVALFAALVFRAAATVADVDREREASLARERRARAEAEEANRAKMDFLAVMSHELRTPLNAIAGYAELMEMGIHGPVTPRQEEALGKIRRSQRHLLLLINDVLNFAKIEAGRVEVRVVEVAVSELIAGVETLILPQAEARGLRYDRRVPDLPPPVSADPDKAGQVLLNLLSNAVKFTPAGGAVRLECAELQGRVRLTVHDTGPGIPPERLESIFEPFVQLERGLSAGERQGTGLGLAISRDLARAMGGDVWAESTPGKGSVFTLELPCAAPAPRPGRDPDPAPPASTAEAGEADEERAAAGHASGL
jgi:signal transduction histidine kinase